MTVAQGGRIGPLCPRFSPLLLPLRQKSHSQPLAARDTSSKSGIIAEFADNRIQGLTESWRFEAQIWHLRER
jgi:hypothetical protein